MTDDLLKDAEIHMQKAIDALRRELLTIRTGRATPALVERVMVEYYGAPTPLNQVAAITAPEARLLQIKPWEKNMIGPIEKAIQKAELGFNPTNDGQLIRIVVPALTEQRRREFVKLIKGHVEDCRVAIRNIRRHAMNDLKELEDEKMIAEDEHKRAGEKVQALVDRYIRDAEHVGEAKEAEVMEV
ncbi:MAG TPA: ribosome recycling factor [Chloroflexia bacterium]|nr:ribosome recycling factor [Chloroflexia bacterium]